MDKQLSCSLILATLLATPLLAIASNGYFDYGYSMESKALAGAGTALPMDSLTSSLNPAGMPYVGNRLDVEATFFSPDRNYNANFPTGPFLFAVAPGFHNSQNKYFILPAFGYNYMLPDNNSSLGIAVYGNGGMNTDYDDTVSAILGNGAQFPGVFGAGETMVDLQQMFANFSFAHKFFNDNFSLGASVIVAMQSLNLKGVSSFAPFTTSFMTTGMANNLSNTGTAYSYGGGVRLGALYQVLPMVTLGASYQFRMPMSKFKRYGDLLPQGGEFDIPPTGNIGLNIALNPQNQLLFDVQEIWYKNISTLNNGISNLFTGCFAGNASACLGGSNGAGFGWNNMTIYKVAWQSEPIPTWTTRVGYSHANQVIPASQVLFNILAPAMIQDHFTIGLGKRFDNDQELNISAMYAPNKTVNGVNPFAPGQTIGISMRQYAIGASYSWLFC